MPRNNEPAPAAGSLSPVRVRMIESDLLRVFVTVVDYGGFTAAAQVLSRTQAAVSLQIKRLEESLEVALLEHPRRELRLTPKGEVLLDYARRLLSLNEEAVGAVRDNAVAGRVRIGAINNYASGILPPLLSAFCARHPEVQIEVHTGVAAEMARKLGSTYDMTINLHLPGSTSDGIVIDRQYPMWVTALANSPHDRDPVPLALLPTGSLFRQLAVEALARRQRPWHLAQESTNIAAIEASVAAGLAVAVFQRRGIDPARLRVLGEAQGFPELPTVEVRLQTAERFLPYAAVQLKDYLLEHLRPGKALPLEG